MTLPRKYQNRYVEVRYFLSSYRALCDARHAITGLERMLEHESAMLSDWKVVWIGICTILRTSIDLFRVDSNICIDKNIRLELKNEWSLIKEVKEDHSIFWDFLRHERDAIIHEYDWRAYEAWLKPDGSIQQCSSSLLGLRDAASRSVLLMKSGKFKGQDSLELLRQSADWVEERIFSAIRRAGFDPEERRSLSGFNLPCPDKSQRVLASTILGASIATSVS